MILDLLQFTPKFSNCIETQSELMVSGNLDFIQLGRKQSLIEINSIFRQIEIHDHIVNHIFMNDELYQNFLFVIGEGCHKRDILNIRIR